MIDRRQLSEALARLDPRDREVLDYSLRRHVPDGDLAAIFDCGPSEVARMRAAAIERLADDLDVQRGADLGQVLTALLESGSAGRAYLLKERIHDRLQLTAAVDAVAEGGSVIDPKVVEVLVAARARAERSPLAELTARETEVLSEIAQGRSNAAIADSLVLTKRAVEKHIHSIFMKLGLAYEQDVSKRVKAALLFLAERDGR